MSAADGLRPPPRELPQPQADALRRAEFESIRGDFQFGNNHFPVQDWYAGNVVSDDQGRTTITLGNLVAEDYQDAYHQDCPMQW